jgi:hypothetical protein
MLSINGREEIVEVLDALDAEVDRACDLSFEALTTRERLRVLERLETLTRRLPVVGHELINQLVEHATPQELGGTLSYALAERLRITRGDATRRMAEAADLGSRRALTGEALAPRLPVTAAAQRRGLLGAGHIAVIRRFFEELPCWVDAPTRGSAESDLAQAATEHRPEALNKLADRLTLCLNPDGQFSDQDRARRRGVTLGKQDSDGMSPLRGWLTPQARATIEAVLAKLAAPGMCNPADDTSTLDGAPTEQAVQHDTRSPAQRHHDGLNTGCLMWHT